MKFLKRQLKTKTGKYVASFIGASVLDHISRNTIGVGVHEVPFVGGILDSVLGADTSSVMLGFSFLRDKQAKIDHE